MSSRVNPRDFDAVLGAVVDRDAEVGETPGNAGPYRGGVLADARGEHERVEVSEHGDKRGDVLGRHGLVDLECQRGISVAVVTRREEVAHVSRLARKSEQTGLVINDVLESVRIETARPE